MSHQHSIMSDELFNLFASKLQDIGLSDQSEASIISASNPSTTVEQISLETQAQQQISFAEERAWMMHQQDPLASSGPFILALRLTGKIDIARLARAIEKLYVGQSNLNLRYDLNEEGVLSKYHAEQASVDVKIHVVQSEIEAIQYLLSWLKQPIDLAKAPAIQFSILPQSYDAVILGILGHHILLDDAAWQPIFSQLNHYYEHADQVDAGSYVFKSNPQRQVKDSTTALQYWKNAFPTGLTPVRWPKFCLATQIQSSIVEYGKNSTFNDVQKAIRCYSYVNVGKIQQLSQQAQASIFHTVVAIFGSYLNRLLGQNSVDLFIPIVEQYDASSLSQIQSSSNILPIRIAREDQSKQSQTPKGEINNIIENVRNQILQGMSNNVPIERILSATKTKRNAIPNVLITQFVESSQYLKLEGVKAETIAIPPIHSDYDLTLAFQVKDEDIHFELTIGDKLSKNIGPLLLEQWLDFIDADIGAWADGNAIFASATQQNLNPSSQQDLDPTVKSEVQITSDTIDEIESGQNIYSSVIQLILKEFKSVLMNPNLQADDNFFDFGGHSILATRVIGKLQSQHAVLIKIADFFNAPTARELAQHAELLNKHVEEQQSIDENREIVAPLTLLQKAFMGFSDQGRDAMYNIPFAFRFCEAVDEQAFHAAFLDILKRHHTLRSIFVQADRGDIFQTVIPMQRLHQHPWFWGSEYQAEHSAQQILRAEANHSFDLMQEFPIRVRFMKDEQGQHILSMLLYHIAMDEWSSGILMHELIQAYRSRVAGQAPIWEKAPRQFHEYAMAQDDSTLQAHIQYWVDTIGKIKKQPPLLPAYATDAEQHNHLDTADVAGAAIEFGFTALQVEQLYALAREYRSSLFYVVYAAVVLASHYLGAGKKILTGTSVACRQDPLYQDTMGYFTNVVMHYTLLNETLTIKDLVQQVQNNIFKAQEYADIPFAIVEDNIRAEGEEWTESPYEVYVQLHAQNALTGAFQLDSGHEIGFKLIEPERNTAKFGLHFEVYEEPSSEQERLRVVINYRVNRYNDTQIQLIRQIAEQVLTCFIDIITQPGESMHVDVRDIRRQLSSIQLPEMAI
ncbi:MULTISPECIES: condensation domain-containing protein [unclassified Acinetobacter]|uniref:condensation domain-containing protein n=1 Tax=unclassified Acinetobacter TaxID=196816 RepID=UPI00190D2A29|nr:MULTISPECIES: condensation domain-containing protein [unclassified Acinetobacter]MBK0065075.1 peptide synthetase [Acinetobacter sp. S55]MBK0068211.1 peptide synthetase [Acinetobacter sp. S54]